MVTVQEVGLAEQVVENLTSIIQVAALPGQVAPIAALRKAMGVNLDPQPAAATTDFMSATPSAAAKPPVSEPA
jgi:hypothetical protein